MTAAFGLVEVALKEIIGYLAPETSGKIGGDLSYDGSTDLYVYLGLVPGSSSDDLEGEWTVDIDVFGQTYVTTMRLAMKLEALLLKRGGHRSAEMILDNAYQNSGPAERPWDDDNVFRIGATYVFTARRTA